MFEAFTKNTGLHKCLCCGQRVESRGKPLNPERCAHAFAVLTAQGFTRKALLTRHREQLDYQSPGLVEWLEARGTSQ